MNSIIKGVRPSKFSTVSIQNLYGLIIMGLAGLTYVMENDWKKALSTCEEGL